MKNVIGKGIDRIDGRLKVTGRATYAQDTTLPAPPAIGVIVGATIGYGRIVAIDTRAASRAPGVLLVLTHRNAGKQRPFGAPQTKEPAGSPTPGSRSRRSAT